MAVWRLLVLLFSCMVLGAMPGSGLAQSVGVVQSEILIVDPERLFDETQLGARMTTEYQAAREELAARNRKLEAELEAEEKLLTDLRAEITPDEFRQMADAFDAKVQDIRKESERRVRDLERSRDGAPLNFMRMVEPVLVDIMRAAGGVVVIDARTVLLRADVIDITDVAIARIDSVIGEGLDPAGNDAAGDDGSQSDVAPQD